MNTDADHRRPEARRWQDIERIFQCVLDAPGEQRESIIADRCAGDPELRREVESLVAASERADTILGRTRERIAADVEDGLRQRWQGRRIGPYAVLGELGSGGTSTVLLAARADDAYQRLVAVKVLAGLMPTEALRHRFGVERQILAQLDHPSIARLYDGGTADDGTPFLVMEQVEGEPIDVYCDHRRLTVSQRLDLFRQVCGAVEHAHRSLIVHRDLKPTNILVTADGAPKLLDFGIAKILDPVAFPGEVEPTRSWMRPMTLGYASPEQIRGRAITTATDVYSLGVLLYLLLTGRRPIEAGGEGADGWARKICQEVPCKPSKAVDGASDAVAEARSSSPFQLRRKITGDLDAIALHALEKEPRDRYPSVADLTEDIERYLAGRPVAARRIGWLVRTAKFVRRHRAAAGAAVIVFVLAIAFVAALVRQYRKTGLEKQRAQQVVDWMVEVFEVSDPTATQGETVTARQVLDQGWGRIADSLADQPVLKADLLDSLGLAYQGLGLYGRARELLEEAVALRQGQQGDPARRASSLLHLGIVLKSEGEYRRARQVLESALEAAVGAHGSDSSQALAAQTALIEALRMGGEYQAAAKLGERALPLARKVHSAGSVELAEALVEFAALEMDLGDFEEAERLHREALAIYRRAFEPPHSRISDATNELAMVLEERGDLAEAELLFRESLEMARTIYGDRHPETGNTIQNLANLLARRGDYAAAVPLFREGLEVDRATLDEDHPYVTASLSNLAAMISETDGARAAEPLFRKALETEIRTLGRDHGDTAITMNNLGVVLRAQGRLDEAEALISEALAIHRRERGPEHQEVGLTLRNLSGVRLDKGELDAAEAGLHEALEILGEDAIGATAIYRQLARVAQRRGQAAHAESLFERAEVTARAKVGENHPIFVRALVSRARLSAAIGHFEAAEVLARRAIESRPGTTDRGILGARARLALGIALAGQGRREEAIAELGSCHQWLRQHQGEQAPDTIAAREALVDLDAMSRD